ncbi:uncharacterized protein [Ptychodera flava]|uniref:uncharacterized protein n=1 Tax=Ptychodera flava TaxID=63121 RepID=UPI003969DB29
MVVRTTGTLLLASLCLFLFSGLSLFSECTGAGELSGVRYGRHVQKRNADGVLTMPCRVYRIHTELKTFYEAKSICQANNGQDAQMAKIPSSTVNEALFALFASSMSENAYFGARDKLTEEIWLYEDGSEVCFQDWAFFRPVTDPTANCATFTLNVGGHWLDDSCLTPRPFICQFTETDDCAPEPCLNGGTCTDEIIGYTCACPSGFTGQNCETGGASCLTEGCQNGGECTESGICQCDSHFIGDACETCVPNSADVSGSFSTISAVYPSTMTLDTNTAFTSFSVGSDTYLVTYQKSGMGDGVAVHQFVPGSPVSYTFIQNLAESEVKHVEAFKILGRQYLAIAQYDTTDVNLHSSIYRMVDGSTTFSKIQTIQSPFSERAISTFSCRHTATS